MRKPLTFRSLAASDFEPVATLARIVWQATYTGIISQAQIDSMLAARYNASALREYIDSESRWFELALLADKLVGFCACEIAGGEYKLDKIYINPQQQRSGIGAALIGRAETRGKALGHTTMILAVNKRNLPAIAAYQKQGFSVRESVCVDIGNGFVMDDYIMQKML